MDGEGSRWRVGMDTGGTFTDLVAIDPAGVVRLAKVSSTPGRPATAVFDAVQRAGLDLPHEVASFVLGTTIATNAVIMRSGARTVLVATAGFEDVLEIQRIDRPPFYDLQWVKAKPYVRRGDVVGVAERIGADGRVRRPLTDGEVARVVARVRDLHARHADLTVAICLLFGYLNDAHEQRLAQALRAALPDVPVSVSSEVSPVWREYERTSTTVMDAYVRRIVDGFVADLQGGAAEDRLPRRSGLMKSNGGQVPLEHAGERPVELVLSGLAGGMIAGAHWARAVGSHRAVTLDMGGTSADVGVVTDGQLQFSGLFEPEWGIPITIPIIDVTTIGAGGSSIAGIEHGGLLTVGPESAGADPGPACYRRGGERATVTDANVVLGRLDPGYFLGGRLTLDRDAAEKAVGRIGEALGVELDEAAEAILSVSIENMAGAVRLVTVDRGFDYREFDLVAFGGAGPLHAVEIARRLGMRRVVVPPNPGLVSAFGSLIADERIDRRATLVRRLDGDRAGDVAEALDRLAASTAAELARQATGDVGGMVVTCFVACRYLGQNYEQEIKTYSGHVDRSFELAVPVFPGEGDLAVRVAHAFHETHERVYGYSLRDQPVETVHLGATAVIPTPAVAVRPYADADGVPGPTRRMIGTREGGRRPADVVHRATLRPGDRVAGPAVVCEENSTTWVPDGYEATVDTSLCLLVTPAGRPDGRDA